MLCSSDKIILLNITFMEKGRKHHKNSWNKIVHMGEEEEHVLVLVLLLAIVKVLWCSENRVNKTNLRS